MVELVFILVSFCASVIGAICGIGGGVIIKPVLDAFGLYSVSTVSFMSGCIVLSMTAYSVVKANLAHESVIEKGVSTWLGIGAALGGLLGKQLFDSVKALFDNADTVGAVQAAALFAITLGTAVYTIKRDKIKTHQLKNPVLCAAIGLALGVCSSFLGIGGGPMNLAVMHYCFSMGTKQAAANSLLVILLSQTANLIFSLLRASIPAFSWLTLAVMVAAGVIGGFVSARLHKKLSAETTDRLFKVLLVVIFLICVSNAVRALG